MTARPASRVALVTGAARGLGAAVATRLAERGGVRLVLCDVEAELLEGFAAGLRGSGHDVLAVPLDVSDEHAVADAFDRVRRELGRVDMLVNSAGVQGLVDGARPSVEGMPVSLWRRTLEINLTGTFLMCQAAIPLMKPNAWGRIVNVASRAARMRTATANANYAASKAGVIGFSRVLAGEVGRHGITVNCVAPSRVETQMTRSTRNHGALVSASAAESVMGRLCEPGDVVNAIVFLLSEETSFVTGTTLDVNGGSYMN